MSLMALTFVHTHAASTARQQGSPNLEHRGDDEVPEQEREREEEGDKPGKVQCDRDENRDSSM